MMVRESCGECCIGVFLDRIPDPAAFLWRPCETNASAATIETSGWIDPDPGEMIKNRFEFLLKTNDNPRISQVLETLKATPAMPVYPLGGRFCCRPNENRMQIPKHGFLPDSMWRCAFVLSCFEQIGRGPLRQLFFAPLLCHVKSVR